MVLADTSVWISHLRGENAGLATLLDDGHVVCHPFIIGELACGNLKNLSKILSLLHLLPMTTHAEHEEVMQFIDDYRLMGKGLGYIDMHLLSSAILSKISLWTFDKRLHEVSAKLGLDFSY